MSSMAYTQLKVSVEPTLAESFKLACKASGASMADVLSRHMALYSGVDRPDKPPPLSTKRQRRAAVAKFAQQLARVRDSEARYRDRIPDNLQNSTVFEAADLWVSVLDDVLDLLESLD